MNMPKPVANANVATTRTTVNTFWITTVLYLIDRFTTVDISLDDPLILAVLPVAAGFFYRLSYILSRFRWWGTILFLIDRNPAYVQTDQGTPGPDAGRIDLEKVLLIGATVAVVVVLAIYYTLT